MESFQSCDASLLSRLEAQLRSQGYSPSTRYQAVFEARRFLKYLAVRQIVIEAVKPIDVSKYLRCELQHHCRRHRHPPRSRAQWRATHASYVHLFLRVINGHWPPIPAPTTARARFQQQIFHDYAQWLSNSRGLAATSIDRLSREAQTFVAWLGERCDPERLPQLTGRAIEAYLTFRAPSLSRRSQKSKAQYLRSFLCYLHGAGHVERDLAQFIVTPAGYAFETIPSALRAEEVQAVVETTRQDRSAKGLRDYAILLLLSTYGLRQGEIAHLRLEDIDWRNETVHIHHSKTGNESYLPLLPSVGEALLAYLRSARPKTSVREIFVRAYAPYRPLCSLYELIQDRLRAAKVRPAGKRGPHAFRHARAASLLRADISIKHIGDILGHRSAMATMSYLKLDTKALRNIALEIPQEVKSS